MKVAVTVLFVFCNIALSAAVVPLACVHNVTSTSGICCPTPDGQTRPCGYPARGVCRRTRVGQDPWKWPDVKRLREDVRIDWPARLFNYTCECVGYFWGEDCGSCWFGYEGSNCQHRIVRVRRNYKTYSGREFQRILSVIEAGYRTPSTLAKTYGLARGHLRGFRNMSIQEAVLSIHGFAFGYLPPYLARMRGGDCEPLDMNHNTPTFILWHRYLLLWWERQLSEIADQLYGMRNFTFPYWDYTDATSHEPCTRDYACWPHEPGCRLSKWIAFCHHADCNNCEGRQNKFLKRGLRQRVISRRLKTGLPLFPTSKEMLNALKAPYFRSTEANCHGASGYIEHGCKCVSATYQMHNLVHNMYSGDMGTFTSSANDPMFFLHHSQLDRLLHRWIVRNKPGPGQIPYESEIPQTCRNCALPGIFPSLLPKSMLVDLRDLGITYDNLSFGPISEKFDIRPSKDLRSYRHFVCRTAPVDALLSILKSNYVDNNKDREIDVGDEEEEDE